MSKKDKPEVVVKMCMNCKHRQKPDAKHITRGWCDNKKSPHFDRHIYKGDSCPKFADKNAKRKGK